MRCNAAYCFELHFCSSEKIPPPPALHYIFLTWGNCVILPPSLRLLACSHISFVLRLPVMLPLCRDSESPSVKKGICITSLVIAFYEEG